MSAKAITEFTGKTLLSKHLHSCSNLQNRFKFLEVDANTDFSSLLEKHPWISNEVIKFESFVLYLRLGKGKHETNLRGRSCYPSTWPEIWPRL